jgi:hypothetical protein
MLAQLQTARPAVPSAVLSTKRQRSLRCFAAAETEVKQEVKAPATSSASGKEIYIGHVKDDYAGKRTGTKGRFVVDDPKKYPGREADNLSGGWAGGEKGLKEFVANYEREKMLNKEAAAAGKEAKPSRTPQPIAPGEDTIYLGNGRMIKGDARKYPTRNELTGGFAGGERGLWAFKESGDVPIAPEGQGKKQTSPLVIAFVLGLAATGGGLLLSTVEEVGESVLTTSGPQLGLDDTTKAALTVSGAVGQPAREGDRE